MKNISGTIVSQQAIFATKENLLQIVSNHLKLLDDSIQTASDLKFKEESKDLDNSYNWFEKIYFRLKKNIDLNQEERNVLRMNIKHDIKQITCFQF